MGAVGGLGQEKVIYRFLGEIIQICCTCVSRRLGWGQEGRIYGPLLGSGGGGDLEWMEKEGEKVASIAQHQSFAVI